MKKMLVLTGLFTVAFLVSKAFSSGDKVGNEFIKNGTQGELTDPKPLKTFVRKSGNGAGNGFTTSKLTKLLVQIIQVASMVVVSQKVEAVLATDKDNTSD